MIPPKHFPGAWHDCSRRIWHPPSNFPFWILAGHWTCHTASDVTPCPEKPRQTVTGKPASMSLPLKRWGRGGEGTANPAGLWKNGWSMGLYHHDSFTIHLVENIDPNTKRCPKPYLSLTTHQMCSIQKDRQNLNNY